MKSNKATPLNDKMSHQLLRAKQFSLQTITLFTHLDICLQCLIWFTLSSPLGYIRLCALMCVWLRSALCFFLCLTEKEIIFVSHPMFTGLSIRGYEKHWTGFAFIPMETTGKSFVFNTWHLTLLDHFIGSFARSYL